MGQHVGCKKDNMSHTHLLRGLFLKEYSLEYSLKILQKYLQKYLHFILFYCVKVYVRDFKIYVIFKSFEVYL